MAKNKEPEKTVESGSDSGEEETDSASSDSESEPEPTPITKKPSPPPLSAAKKPQPKPASSEEESETDSDSDGSEPPKSSGGARKPTPAAAVTPAKPAAAKRPAEEKAAKDAKKLKKDESVGEKSEAKSAAKDAKKLKKDESVGEKSEAKSGDNSKKPGVQAWSEDEEIVVLKGLIEYRKKAGSNSSAAVEANAVRELIMEDLDVAVNRLQEKIRRMKKKYETNKGKEKEGKELDSRPHERRVYDLSKLVWGDEGGNRKSAGEKSDGGSKGKGSVVKKSQSSEVTKGSVDKSAVSCLIDVGGSAKENESLGKKNRARKGDEDVNVAIVEAGISRDVRVRSMIVRTGEAMFEGGDMVEGAKEWRRLRVAEVELELKRLELMKAQTKLVLDVLRSDG